MHTLIEARGVSKTYGTGEAQVTALYNVDLSVHAGEVLLLAGPSGSGKTTLLSILGAILRPSSGSVNICGTEIADMKEADLPRIRLANIGFVFQGFNLFPALTARENVELALNLKWGKPRLGRSFALRAEELLDQVGLRDKQSSYPADLSGGQKQRVAIARALAGEPRVLLADEPTAALDSTSGRVVMELLSSLAKTGRAVVIVTHDSRVFSYADRMVHLNDGAVESMADSAAANRH
jgi:putative ABC transport system ATP-binding protein